MYVPLRDALTIFDATRVRVSLGFQVATLVHEVHRLIQFAREKLLGYRAPWRIPVA